MLLRLKLHGNGADNNPYSVPVPNGRLVHANISQGYAIVALTDSDLDESIFENEPSEDTTEGRLYTSLSPATIQKIYDRWDKNYKGGRERFRLELV